MKLTEVARMAGVHYEGPDPEISDIAFDSREVGPGCLFFCVPGEHVDGHDYAGAAASAGAAALVVSRETNVSLPSLVVHDVRAAMEKVAAPFFGYPSHDLHLFGVTGTNGKTTTSFMAHSIFATVGRAGLIGTVQTRIGAKTMPAGRTTPEAIDLQRLLRSMADDGVTYCAMEASSEGIHKCRVRGTYFEVSGFTNLTQDHLDYHGTMEEYFLAKQRLFRPDLTGHALINIDDEYGRRLARETEVPASTYAIDQPADLVATGIELGSHGTRFKTNGMLSLDVQTRLPGRFNVYNALAAAGAAHMLGVGEDAILDGLASLNGVPGRFEAIDAGQDFAVIVDYAHTPDSLINVLVSAREMTRGRIIVVFGCGGDRDKTKRPLMGSAAGRHADIAIATSDNPRSEDPIQILNEVSEGLTATPPPGGYSVLPDRREAIRHAIVSAAPGDVVVIAGKGHETGQEFADRKIDFDDRVVAAEELRAVR